jgi:hypothetical protein
MLGGYHPLLLLLVVVIAVSTTGDSIVDLKISRINASRAVKPGRRQLTVAGDRPVCLIVAYDKIKGHLNWMQVRPKCRNFAHRLRSSYQSLYLQDWFQKAAKERCRHTVSITENKNQVRLRLLSIFSGTVYYHSCVLYLTRWEAPTFSCTTRPHTFSPALCASPATTPS